MYIKLALVFALLANGSAFAANIAAAFSSNYHLTDLGNVPNGSGNYGGIAFLPGDPNTMLLVGAAGYSFSTIDKIGLIRDSNGHITGFTSTSTYVTVPYLDSLAYGPNGILFFSDNFHSEIGEFKPGSSVPDKVVASPLSSVSPLGFIPAGFNGEGNFVMGSASSGTLCIAPLTADGNGTYGIETCGATVSSAAPTGIAWVPLASTQFDSQSVLITESPFSRISAYQIDAAGLPIAATRTDLVQGVTAGAAIVDPVTGDLLFDAYGTGNQNNRRIRIMEIQGFASPSVPEPATTLLGAGGLLLISLRRFRKSLRRFRK
jgi:hypothetical protein